MVWRKELEKIYSRLAQWACYLDTSRYGFVLERLKTASMLVYGDRFIWKYYVSIQVNNSLKCALVLCNMVHHPSNKKFQYIPYYTRCYNYEDRW
jgi:hypothetical protein